MPSRRHRPLAPRRPRTPADTAVVTITSNLGLDDAATSTQTGTVGEPCVAASSKGLLVTGNWYASWSPDAGKTWEFLDPFITFPADRGRFCCDQLVQWIPKARLWVWLLQYESVNGANIFRLAVSPTGTALVALVGRRTDGSQPRVDGCVVRLPRHGRERRQPVDLLQRL